MFIDFRNRGRKRNIDVRNIDQLPPTQAPSGDWTCNLGMCSDRKLNPQPFGVQDGTPSNWATWPGLILSFFLSFFFFLRFYLFIFRERRREKERETSMWGGNVNQLPLIHTLTSTEPATQTCALTGNWTRNFSPCGMMPLGWCWFFMLISYLATLLFCWLALTVLGVFSIYTIMSSANRHSFTSSFPILMFSPFSFCLAWLFWVGLLLLCWLEMVRMAPLYYSYLREKDVNLSSLMALLAMGLWDTAFTVLRYTPSVPKLLRLNWWHNIWCILEHVLCVLEKNVYTVVKSSVLCIYLLVPSGFVVLSSLFPYLFFLLSGYCTHSWE